VKFLLDRVAAGDQEWRIVADTRQPTAWVLDGRHVYEFANKRDALQHVVSEYRRVADLRSMQPGQNYNLTMQDGSTRMVQVQNQTPDGVQVLDPNSGQTMMIPHVQPGAEPKPAQAPQQAGASGQTPKPNQPQNQAASPVSPENQTDRTYALGLNDLRVTASEYGRTPQNCKHDGTHLNRKNPSDPEKFCPDCGMVYAAERKKATWEDIAKEEQARIKQEDEKRKKEKKEVPRAAKVAYTPGPPEAGKFYFCSRCNTSRTAMLDREGQEVHRALADGTVVRYLSCKHPTAIDDAPVQPAWQPKGWQPKMAALKCEKCDALAVANDILCAKHRREYEESGAREKNGATKTAVITGGPGSYHVKSEEGKNLGGPYKSREQAEHRLKQVEYFKHKGGKTAGCDSDYYVEGDDCSCPLHRKKKARDAFRAWKNRERIVHAFDLIAEPVMPGNQAMPSGDQANEGETLKMDEKGPADFAEEPESQPSTQDPNAKRRLTPHEIIEEAESLIRNALVKGVKIGAAELSDYMTTYYNNPPDELMQGITLAWQKVQYEEKMEGGGQGDPNAPGGEGFGPKPPTTPEQAAQMAPRNGPIRTKSML
jgi:hypothetical protein